MKESLHQNKDNSHASDLQESDSSAQFEQLLALSQNDDRMHQKTSMPFIDRLIAPYLIHADDAVLIRCLGLIIPTCALSLYANFHFSWLSVGLFFVAFIVNGQAIATYLHASSHRSLFKPAYDWLNHLPIWILSPWVGDPPYLFAVEHVLNHHAFDNRPEDLSCTMTYQRDSVREFMRYLADFFFGKSGILGLAKMFRTRGGRVWRNRFIGGQIVYWGIFLILLSQNWQATCVVFLGAFVLFQTINRANNWVEHAFINPEMPLDPLGNSYTILNSKFNAGMGGNEGYHGTHHVRAGLPNDLWPKHFRDNLQRYCDIDHLILQKTNSFDLLALLFLKDYRYIARHYVNLPGRQRTEDEIVALIKERVAKLPLVL